jgi:hypothetical protein
MGDPVARSSGFGMSVGVDCADAAAAMAQISAVSAAE